jgi:hypothetical protein
MLSPSSKRSFCVTSPAASMPLQCIVLPPLLQCTVLPPLLQCIVLPPLLQCIVLPALPRCCCQAGRQLSDPYPLRELFQYRIMVLFAKPSPVPSLPTLPPTLFTSGCTRTRVAMEGGEGGGGGAPQFYNVN